MARWKLQQHIVFYAILMGALTLAGDYVTGPYIQFPILFVLPVILTSWYHSYPLGLGLAICLPILRLGLPWHWDASTPWTFAEPLVNTLVRIVVLGIIAYMTDKASQENRALKEEVRTLRGFLPICMHCKRIQDDQGEWQILEAYIMSHSEATFTHGLCPACLQEHYGHHIVPQ